MTHRFHWILLVTVLTGCNPYVSAVSMTYGVATDARSVSTQASDTEAEGAVKASLLESPVAGTDNLNVWCRQGVIVLAGVVPPGSSTGAAAVQIARTTPGVASVETFFVAERPSEESDLEIEAEIKAAFAADPDVMEERASVGVYGGHVVLVGVVKDPTKIDKYVADAQGVSSVRSVRSYIQLVN